MEKEKRFLNFISYYAQYGWLEVKTSKNYKDFMWTSGRNTHDPFERPAMNLTLDIETGMVKFYMESALSMWIKYSAYIDDDKYLPNLKKYIKEIEYFMLEDNNDK